MKTLSEKLTYLLLVLCLLTSCNQSIDNDEYLSHGRENQEEFATSIKIGTKKFDIDAREINDLGDGLKYVKLQLKDQHYPLVVHAVQMDRRVKNISVKTLSGKKEIKGREKVSSMVVSNTNEKQEVLAAINGDFFEFAAASPLGGQVLDGVIQRLVPKSWNTSFYTDEQGIPYISQLTTKAKVSVAKAFESIEITDFNTTRGANSLIFFDSSHTSDNTGTNIYGGEILLKPIGFEWGSVNMNNLKNLKFEIEKITKMDTGGAMEIPKGKVVLSAHGTAYNWLSKLEVGNEINIDISFSTIDYLRQSIDIQNLCGAHQIVMKNSFVVKPTANDELITARHPRSAIGMSPDRKKITMIVVEGRSDISKGATIAELADICTYFNLSDAANLDGGGSSCVVAKGKILNTLSDKEERAVANALAFVKNK